MSSLDIFAWIVLIVLAASTMFVIIFMAMLPGIIARSRSHRGHRRSIRLDLQGISAPATPSSFSIDEIMEKMQDGAVGMGSR